MPSQRSPFWKLEPHTVAKHEILRRYLNAWLPILASGHRRLVYIDGFAGPGRYEDGEPGSPMVALRAILGHQHRIKAELVCVFIEEDASRKSNLEQEIAGLPLPSNVTYRVILGKFDSTITGLLDELDGSGGNLAPTFAFIDPFGWSQTPLSLVRRLLSKPRCEVLITFIYEELNRFASVPLPNDGRDDLFRTSRWREVLQLPTPGSRRDFLRDLYEHQLREVAGAKYVKSFEMINRHNATDLLLFFATNNQLGLSKMKEAMWQVDPTGTYRFSDVTNRNQPMLFDAVPDFALLRSLIHSHFRGQTVSIEDITDFVLEETPFLVTHFKRRVLGVMEGESPPALRVVKGSANRKRGGYPPGTVVQFM